jgi:hypothetical protein
VAPVAAIALYGALWIALHAGGGRGSTHTMFQSLALAETVLALLLRRRKPVGALAGILAVYLLFSLDPLLLPAALLALVTVAASRDHRTAAVAAAATAAATAAGPYIRGHAVSFTGYSLPRLAAAGAVVAAGLYLRAQRNRRAVNPAADRRRADSRPGSSPWNDTRTGHLELFTATISTPPETTACAPLTPSAPPSKENPGYPHSPQWPDTRLQVGDGDQF